MIITVAKVSPEVANSVRTLVRNPDHQVTFAPELLGQPVFTGQMLSQSLGLGAVAQSGINGHTLYGDLGLVGAGKSVLANQPSSVALGGTSEATVAPATRDIKKLYKVVHKGVWPLAKEAFPLSNSAIEGVEVVFAVEKLWSRITSDDGIDKVQVALAATDFGLELYDIVSKFYPSLPIVSPYRKVAGLLINGADVTYAAYFTESK